MLPKLFTFYPRWGIRFLTSCAIAVLLIALPSVAQEEDSAAILLRAGNALRDSFNYNAAISHYQRALDHNPNNLAAVRQIAFAYLEVGNVDRSLDMALQGARLQSEWLPEFNALAALDYNYAIIISEYHENIVHRTDSDVVAFRAYQHDLPEGAAKIFGLGLTYWAMGRTQTAEECLQEAMELDTASEAPLILGLMWLQQGRYREAKVMLEKFLHPDSFLAARVRLLIENIQRKQGEP